MKRAILIATGLLIVGPPLIMIHYFWEPEEVLDRMAAEINAYIEVCIAEQEEADARCGLS